MNNIQHKSTGLRKAPGLCLLLFIVGTLAHADRTLYVSSEGNATPPYLTWTDAAHSIHDAVATATNTDIVVVGDGRYTLTNMVTINTAITLRSANGAQATIIDANGSVTENRAFHLNHAGAVIAGFTISNGVAENGGGLHVQAGTLRDSIICGNTATKWGGGIYANGGNIIRCIISNNNASASYGGGAYLHYSSARLRNSIIVANTSAGNGGGIYCNRGGRIENCLIIDNTALTQAASAGGGGVYFLQGGGLYNSTVSGNTGRYGGGLLASSGNDGTGLVHNSIVQLNNGEIGRNVRNLTNTMYSNSCFYIESASYLLGDGNFSDDPLFVDSVAGDYRLKAGSPCIDTGINLDWMIGRVDLDGNRRIDGISGQVDVGCYEYTLSGSVLIAR